MVLTILVRGPTGQSRIQCNADDSLSSLKLQIESELNLKPQGWDIQKHMTSNIIITGATAIQTLESLGIKNRDVFTVKLREGVTNEEVTNSNNIPIPPAAATATTYINKVMSQTSSPLQNNSANSSKFSSGRSSVVSTNSYSSIKLYNRDESGKKTKGSIIEDGVDKLLSKESGRIKREFDPMMCNHNRQGKCTKCVDLEPYDKDYRDKKGIKHMSFQAYIRYLRSGADKGKFKILDEIRCKIKPGGCSHPPWPQAICTQCQPSAITLDRQSYRQTDYVQFESPQVLNQFINFWRQSGGKQRIGFLIGKYDIYPDVPLGVKAIVCAIYEPPQNNTRFKCQLEDSDCFGNGRGGEGSSNSSSMDTDDDQGKKDTLETLCKALGLQVVGLVFTDLEDKGEGNGKVHYKRHKDSYYLSSYESVLSARMQNKYKAPSKHSPSGVYGSKFVTVCVTGNSDGDIAIEAYQVSHQAMALEAADILRPCTNIAKCCVKKMSDLQYVPEIFYSEKNEYNAQVTLAALPSFPLDFLLVNVSSGTPANVSETMFASTSMSGSDGFPIENRQITQNFDVVAKHINPSSFSSMLQILSDFHFLYYIASSDRFNLQPVLDQICTAVSQKDQAMADSIKETPEWKKFTSLVQSSTSSNSGNRGGGSSMMGDDNIMVGFTCKMCTFQNSRPSGDCEMCGIPDQ